MKKEDINYEFISKIEIQIEDTLFYLPGETIKGNILLNPKYQMKIKDKMLHLSLKIMQYEFWEYSNTKIEEIRNIHVTKIQEEKIDHELNSNDKNKTILFQNFELIEKEDEDKMISIPFQITINEETILPTFQYENKNYILGIRHLLVAECKEYNSSNYIGLFIGKIKNKEFISQQEIKGNYKVGLDSLELIANFKKRSYTFEEQIDFDIETKTNLHFQKITKLKQEFYRKMEWIGYMKNSILTKDILDSQVCSYNANEHGNFAKLVMPIIPIVTTVCTGTAGALLGCFCGVMIGGYMCDLDIIKEYLPDGDNDNSGSSNCNQLSNIVYNSEFNKFKQDNNMVDNNDSNKINEPNNISNSDSNIIINPNNKENSDSNEIIELKNEDNTENEVIDNNNNKKDSIKIIEFNNNDSKDSNKIQESNNNSKDNSESNEKNENKVPIEPKEPKKISVLGGIIGGIFGGLLGTSFGAITGFVTGVSKQYDVMKDILNINDNQNNIVKNFSPKAYKPEQEKIIIENLNKFVYFKNNKVVGFIRFASNVIPPVNGYYFKCNYNIKINVEIAGIILSSKKYLKTKLDLYDSDEYISKMKQILKINPNKN